MRILYHYAAGPAMRAELSDLEARGLRVQCCAEHDDARFAELLPDTDVLWHCLRPVDDAVFAAAPNLRLVQKIGVGLNTIDLDAARRRGIAVCNLPGSNSRAVAEHTLMLMLAVLRRGASFDRLLRAGAGWRRPEAPDDRLGELAGRRVGLIGFGAVPRLLTPVLQALGAEVSFHSRRPVADAPAARVPLDELLSRSDVLSLHVPLADDTHHLIDAAAFERMKPGAILVNTARGDLVDEGALLAALEHGPLAGAGLDVFATEPLPADHPFMARDDVVLTPHVAWLTRETFARSIARAAENCQRLARGEPLLDRVA